MLKKIVQFLTQPSTTNIGFRIIRYHEGDIFHPQNYYTTEDLRPNPLRWSKAQFEHIADPFLFSTKDELHCFFEVKDRSNPGYIKVLTINNQGVRQLRFCNLGIETHISFPFIFNEPETNQVYMIPETRAEGEVAIYEPITFPVMWEKKAVILRGNFVDSHILKYNNFYYLFTTEKMHNLSSYDYQLNIYVSNNLLTGYKQHPMSPVKLGKKYSRCGGRIISCGGKLYRIAQDCETSYGKELNLFEITEISPTNYSEKISHTEWVVNAMGHQYGGHHLSETIWSGEQYLAIDFNYKDSYFQRFFYKFMQLVK